MPRIDPHQLLSTLSVLLSPAGGIKSNDEVVRLVQLMQKFSKKLVSKSIYIEILKATSPPLLERFLKEKGWDLLNIWFSDSIKNQNWPLCHSIISLFVTCPVSAELLKDMVEVNQAPKLINQLRVNSSISDDIRILADAVYNKWVTILSPQKSEFKQELISNSSVISALRNVRKVPTHQTGIRSVKRVISRDFIEDSDDSDDQTNSNHPVQPPVTLKIKLGKGVDKKSADEEENGNPISLLQSLANEVSEDLKKEKAAQKEEKPKQRRTNEEDKNRRDKDKKVKEKEKEKDKEKRRKHLSHNSELNEKERKKFRVDRRDEVDADEKQRIREKARLLKEEAQAKKDKETLSKVGKASYSTTFSRIPKIPKKISAVDEGEKGGQDSKNLSFEEMLGELDTKPKTVKVPQIKNKTAALLESFSKTKSSEGSSSRSHHHSSSSSKREDSRKEKESSSCKKHSSFNVSKRHEDEKHSSSKPAKLTIPKKSTLADLESPKGKNNSFSESTGFMDAILSSMGGNTSQDARKKKRRLSEKDDDSPSSKKSPKGEPDKKEIKTEEEGTDAIEEQKPVFSFYRDILEEQTKEEQEIKKEKPTAVQSEIEETSQEESKSEDLPFEEPDQLPREVKGILVLHRGLNKRNKKIQFKKESDLVDVRFFELDETERVNVNKIKFENMRQMELEMEKAALKSKDTLSTDENEVDRWTKPITIDVTNRDPFVPGHLSKEREIQFNREKTVLTAFFYNKDSIPETPLEPDSMALIPNGTPVSIPLEDISADGENLLKDFAKDGWPEPKTNQIDRQAEFESNFSLNPALNELLSNLGSSGITSFMPQQSNPQQLSQEEQRMLQAQTEAMAKLGMIPGVDVPSNFPPPRNQGPIGGPGLGPGPHLQAAPGAMAGPGPHHGPGPMSGHHQQPPPMMEDEAYDYPMEDQEFYEGPPQQGFGPPPQHFERGRGSRGFRGARPPVRFPPNDQMFGPNRQFGNNFGPQQFGPGNNFPPRGRGFPPQPNRGFRGGGGGPPIRGHNDFRDIRRPRGGGMPMGGPPGGPRPCKFFNERGFCRDGENCRFLH